MEEFKFFHFLKKHPIASLIISGLVFLSGSLLYALSKENRDSLAKDISHIEKLLTNHVTGIKEDMDEMKAGQAKLEIEMKAGQAKLESDMKAGQAKLETEMKAGQAKLETEMKAGMEKLENEIKEMRKETNKKFDRLFDKLK